MQDDVKNNTSALRYLETISQLENSFTVLTENVTETSVQLSAPKELKDEVHVKKVSFPPFFPLKWRKKINFKVKISVNMTMKYSPLIFVFYFKQNLI
ncbi:unnamed protein product [Schistosoma curassoni]|uniref:Uncharacterized protein n=1 Tax=Schistosoma curassoni TaxID=6186 RepID=A0A183JTX0_9TREM|nr:unnamed protein product [Schistosoma curassoni]